jgi:rod shape-determining protein MreC
MASANRRPGNSRRAQYGTFFGYFAGVLGVIIGAALLILSYLNPVAFATLRGLATGATAPVGEVSATTRKGALTVYDVAKGYVLAGARGAKMQAELRQDQVTIAELRASAEENRRLKALLGIALAQPRPVAVARLVSATASSTRRFAAISAGHDRAVAVGMPVRSQLGLVGRVLEVGPATARVLLITDVESLVPVRRATDGVPAFAQGRGDGQLQIRLINLGINPLRKGDVFVTSGSGGLYPPGIAVAAATELTHDGAVARVLSDPAATDFVLVYPPWAEAAAQVVALPPPSAIPPQPPRAKAGSKAIKPNAGAKAR